MNKTITHLSLRAAALLAVLVLTILAAPSESKAQGIGYGEPYYLTLNPNYDGAVSRLITVNSPYNFTLSAYEFDRSDYILVGWATSADGAVVYQPGQTITLTGNMTLYAKWAKPNCNVYFDANGGTQTMGTVTQAGGTNYTIPACGFTKEGYGFIGWATSADGAVVYLPGQTITLTDDVTLYAKWEVNRTVTFDANGGTGTMDPVTQVGSYTIPGCGFTKEGYGFIGWATSADGAVVYLPMTTIMLTDDLTLYAKWAEGISGTCGTGVTWSLTKSEGSADYDLLTIFSSIANGYMDDYNEGGSPWYAYRGQIKTIVIGDGVTYIGSNAFKDCTGAISISFGNSVKYIEFEAFRGCSSLTSLNIPSSVHDINLSAFYECTSLRSVTIGSGLRFIDGNVFGGCSQLTSVTIYATSVPNCVTGIFSGNVPGRKIYVPAASVEAYKANQLWSEYASAIKPLDVIIEDGNDKSVLTAVNGQTKNIALKRTFPKGKKQTVCLPFAPTELLNHGKVWQFTGISEEGGVKKAVMTQVTSGPLSANTPYIFEATSDVWSMTFGGSVVNISEYPETVDATAGFTFHGTYEKKHWDANDDDVKNGHIYGFLMEDSEDDPSRKEGMFVKAKYNTNVRPFSCYLEYNGELTGTQTTARRKASAEELPDVIEIEWKSAAEAPGEATGIDELRIKNLELRGEGWYSLDGRRLSGRPTAKGLYIHNGKLVIKN